jgi:hypothetical protein
MGPCHIDPPGNELSYLRIYALTYMGAERGVNTAREVSPIVWFALSKLEIHVTSKSACL